MRGLDPRIHHLQKRWMAGNAHSFLTGDTLDPDKTRKALAPMLDEAIKRVEKWTKAD